MPGLFLPGIFIFEDMKKLLILFSICLVLVACSNTQTDKPKEEKATAAETKDTAAAGAQCITPIKDPNNPKPMAMMMRTMADEAQRMKDLIIAGKTVTKEQFPFIRFYLVEPTDTSVLQPQFFENARLFQAAYNELVNHDKDQQKYYTAYIGKCVSCHESYCSGPLKRIRKLFINP